MQLNGKTILLTGGTDGIGRELAGQLKAKGATLIVTGRTPERIEAAKAAGFEVIAADLSSQAGVDTILAAVKGRDIDVLINNAGLGSDHDFREAMPDLADNDRCITANLNAPIHMITNLMPVLPPVVETKLTAGRGGKSKMPAPECAAQIVDAIETNAKEANVGMTKLLRIVESISPALARKIMINY